MNAKFTQILSLMVGLMVLSASALYAQPANNECSGAVDVSALFDGNNNSSTLFDNTDATSVGDPTNGFACFGEATPSLENSIWFTFVGDGNPYTITTSDCGSTNYIDNADAQIATYSGACGGLTPIANGCNEDGPGSSAGDWFSEVTIETVAGTTYYMLVDGFQASAGEFCLLVGPANFITECEAGTVLTTGVVQVMGPDETFTLEAEGVIVPNSPTQGQLAWYFNNENTDGSGGLGGAFWLNIGSSNEVMYNRDLNGILSNNNFPIMAGTWEITTRVWADAATTTTVDPCDSGEGMLTVLFDPAPVITECGAGTLTTTGTVTVDDANPTFTISVMDRIIPNDPTQGGYTWSFTPGPDGTGNGAFSFGVIAAESSTYTADLNGVLPNSLGGTWYVKGQTSTDGTDINAAANSICDVTLDSLTVLFPGADPGPCDAGSFISTATQTACPGETFAIALNNGSDSIPAGGGLGWFFDNSEGGTGGQTDGTFLPNGSSPAAFNNDLNGFITSEGLSPLQGTYILRSATYTNSADPRGSVCSTSSDSILLILGDIVDLEILENGNELTASVGPNLMDFNYVWSTGETEITITALESGDFTVTATDNIGCETVATITVTVVSTNEADIINKLSVSPNPTLGLVSVALDLPASKEVQLSVIDITGKEVINLAPATFTSRNFEVNLQEQASGLYLLRFRIGNDVVTRRVVKK